MAATVSPEKILGQLHGLWDSLDREERKQEGASVLRSCVMTLVVLAEEIEDPAGVGETLAALMPEHPSRAISIRLRAPAKRGLTSRVYAQCWKPFGQRRQICCEQIEISASDADLGELPSLLLPLAVPDFPVVIWCRSPRLAGIGEFEAIARIGTKVVLDSTAFPDTAAGLRIAARIGRVIPVGDLAWTRLTRWRSVLAQVFEDRQYLARLPGVATMRVTWGGSYRALAWYMAAWLADSLADAGAKPLLETIEEGREDLIRVEMSGPGLALRMAREETRLVVRVNELSQCTGLSRPSDYALLREELGIVRRDPVFERALGGALRMGEP